MNGLFTSFIKSSAALLFPPLCLHCSATALKGFFCINCLQQLEMIAPAGRCSICFGGDVDRRKGICHDCRKWGRVLDRSVAAFDFYGPAATLVRQMKYGGQAYLAKGAAGFMAAQFMDVGMELPDYLVPVPMPLFRKIERGYNQSLLLAQSLGEILGRPVLDCLCRESNPYKQAAMNKRQRLEQLGEITFRGGDQVRGKRVLLVDDVYTTGGTLHACAESLWGGFPKSVEGLVLCRGI